MRANLVCEGGGVKGIALVGAVSALETNDYEWDNIAGTSAGSIVAALIAVGYNSEALKKILMSIDYKKMSDKTKLSKIPVVGKGLSLLINKGICKGSYIEEVLTPYFIAKDKTKFKDVSENGVSKLKIIACDVTRHKLLILPDDLVNYGIDPMEFEIVKAIRMSISIPSYYTPEVLKSKTCKSYIVDGGLLSNFPIWIFENASDLPTIGLRLDASKGDNKIAAKEDTRSLKSSLSTVKENALRFSTFAYYKDIIETLFSHTDEVCIRNATNIIIISIPTFDIGVTDFDIKEDQIMKLYKSGYSSASEFVCTSVFKNYIYRYGKSGTHFV